MNDKTILGTQVKTQQKAAQVLTNTDEELTYDDLRNEVNASESTMQAVIRGLRDNGVLKTITRKTGARVYTVQPNIDIEKIYASKNETN